MLLLHFDPLVHLRREQPGLIIRSCADLHKITTAGGKGCVNDRCISYKNSLKMVDTREAADLEAPTIMKQLRSLLHFAGYYRKTK